MLYNPTLEAGTHVYSLHPERGPHDSGSIPPGFSVYVAGVDYSVPGDYLNGRVIDITEEIVIKQTPLGGESGVWADLGSVVVERRQVIHSDRVDCGGMMVVKGVNVYFRR